MDISLPITYRGFSLNDPTVGPSTSSALHGCVVDSGDMSDADVVQFLEKRSLQDGMDAGDPYLGMLRIRLAGTLYGSNRTDLFDRYWAMRKALSPTLASRESPGDHGYLPFYFSTPTARLADYPSGQIDLRVLAMPKGKQLVWQRNNQGGSGADPLAIPWQATFVCKDPTITAALPTDVAFTDTVVVTGVTATASTDLVNKTAHGLVAGDRIYFTALNGGAGLVLGTAYYVIASGLTANAFKVSATLAGSAVNITTDAIATTSYAKVVTVSGNFTNRGTYHSPLNFLIAVGPQAGVITVQAGGVILTVTVPASTGNRTVGYDGKEKVAFIAENSVETTRMDIISYSVQNTYPMIVEGVSAYTVTFVGVVTDPGAVGGSHMWFWETYA